MIRTILIDDEPLARSMILEYLQEYPEIEVIRECNDGFEGLKAIMQDKPDLLFLDIQMPKINGFEMLELVEEPPAVIFTTAYDEYAMKAFESNATDYLLKPFSRERFDRALQKFLDKERLRPGAAPVGEVLELAAQSPNQSQRVVVKNGAKIKIIPVWDIRYIEAADDYVKIHSKDGSFLKNKTMGYFEKILDATHFVRVHRSYIVNIAEITRIDPYEKDSHILILKDNTKVPVSKSGYAKLREVLGL